MLPFKKSDFGASPNIPTETRKPDDGSDFDSLEAAGQDLIDAVKSGDAKAVAAALRAAFELVDGEPHEEGPHTNEE